jgi:hypothetical protein
VELVNVIRSSVYPILITGDFNMTRKDSEKNKRGGYNRWSPLFNDVIEQKTENSLGVTIMMIPPMSF